MKIGQIGFGFVGGALHRSFLKKGVETAVYDKYKDIGSLKDLLDTDVIFMCLPTPYVEGHGFSLNALIENLRVLSKEGYAGLVVLKSTVEPGITADLAERFGNLCFCHNPEFLTARTADEDFHTQEHIVLGYDRLSELSKAKVESLAAFFEQYYPKAHISVCTSDESESMKLFCNNFYAIKVQIFNEFHFLCERKGIDFEVVKDLMLKNKWINPMHTNVPGPDGQPSYGGACFPKDTNALNHLMKTAGTPNKVLQACIDERDSMRDFKLK